MHQIFVCATVNTTMTSNKKYIHWNFKMQFHRDAYLTVWLRFILERVLFCAILLVVRFLQFSDHKNFCVSHDIPLARTKFDIAKITQCLKRNRPKKKKRCISDDRLKTRTKNIHTAIFLCALYSGIIIGKSQCFFFCSPLWRPNSTRNAFCVECTELYSNSWNMSTNVV